MNPTDHSAVLANRTSDEGVDGNELYLAAISRQFEAALDMLENALQACPEALWRVHLWEELARNPGLSEFWYILYHTLFWTDLYLSGSVEGFLPPAPFSLDELDPAGLLPERPYTRAELQVYLDHAHLKFRSTVAALTEEQARRTCTFPWGELPFAELLLDILRHIQEHAAQLSMILGQKSGWSARWVTIARKPTAETGFLPMPAPGSAKSSLEVSIRPASPGDAAAARACVIAAFEGYIERMGKPPAPMLLDFPAQIQAGHVWLAALRGELAGVLVQYETEQGFYIDTLAVQPDRQGLGIGRRLLAFAEQEAVRLGCSSVYLCTNAKMTENQVFYPRLGYVEYERKIEAGYERIFYRKRLKDTRA